MKKLIPVVAASAFILGATSVQAAGTYAFLGVGQAEYDDVGISSGNGIKVDDTDVTYSFGIGYRFNDNFGLEGGYTDLGQYKATASVIDTKLSADTDGFFLGVRGMMPIHEKVGLYGRAGFLHWESDLKASGPLISGSAEGDGTDPYFGLGIEYRFDKVASVYADWSRYNLDDEMDDVDIDALTLGVTLYY